MNLQSIFLDRLIFIDRIKSLDRKKGRKIMNKDNKQHLPISVKQAKLLGNTLRVKIIAILSQEPKTAKQVANELGESPGNVHYHIQQLYKGELIDLVEEKPVGGVIEKYYQARATSFQSDHAVFPELGPDFTPESSVSMNSALHLTEENKEKLLQEFRALIEKWVYKTSTADYADADEYVIGVQLVSRKEKQKDDG